MDLCPICGSSCRRLREASRCVSCGIVRTDFSYDSNIYKLGYANTYVEYQKNPVNNPLNLYRLGLVSRWLKSGQSLLDVGCCIGEFIRFSEPYYSCLGFEPNKFAACIARTRVNSPVVSTLGVNQHFPKELISMFDVLEHIEDPYSFLDFLAHHYLIQTGVVVITTPNVGAIPSWDDTGLYGWKHYKPKEHLFLYTEQGLTALFNRLGFEILHFGTEESDIRPGNSNGDILTCVVRKTL